MAALKKLKPTLIVESISDALMRIMKHSTNINFVRTCCSKLQAVNLQDAEKKLKLLLWFVFKSRYGILPGTEEKSSNIPQTEPQPVPCSSCCIQPPLDTELEPVITDESVPYYEMEDVIDNELHYIQDTDKLGVNLYSTFPDACTSFENYLHDENLCSSSCKPGLEDYISLYSNEDVMSYHLTSTPTEKECKIGENDRPDNSSLENLRLDIPNESLEQICSISGVFEEDLCEVDIDEISCSWDSLRLSDIQLYSSQSLNDPSLNFSRPECLNQSQLVGDITDCTGEDFTKVSYNEDKQGETLESAENVLKGVENYSQNMIARALCDLKGSILQENEILSNFPLNSSDVNSRQAVSPQTNQENERHQSFSQEELTFINSIREFLQSKETSSLKDIQQGIEKSLTSTLSTSDQYIDTICDISIDTKNENKPLIQDAVPDVSFEDEIEIIYESHPKKVTLHARNTIPCDDNINSEMRNGAHDPETNCKADQAVVVDTNTKHFGCTFLSGLSQSSEISETSRLVNLQEENKLPYEDEFILAKCDSLSQVSDTMVGIEVLEISSEGSDTDEASEDPCIENEKAKDHHMSDNKLSNPKDCTKSSTDASPAVQDLENELDISLDYEGSDYDSYFIIKSQNADHTAHEVVCDSSTKIKVGKNSEDTTAMIFPGDKLDFTETSLYSSNDKDRSYSPEIKSTHKVNKNEEMNVDDKEQLDHEDSLDFMLDKNDFAW